jgi:glycosyltransferase involved in cell wall biosynthesis
MRLFSMRLAAVVGIPVVTHSKFAASSVLKQAGFMPVLIPLGVGASLAPSHTDKEQARRLLGLENGKTVVLWVGRLVPFKDPNTFLKAVTVLKNEDIIFLMKVRKFGNLVSSPPLNVIRDDLTVDQMMHLYSAADVFVHTGRYESFGLVVLEAMALGVPVIVPDEGAPAEYVGSGGLIFKAGDPGSLAESIRMLMNDSSLRQQLGEAAAREAGRLSWKSAAEAHLRTYARAERRPH